MPDEKPQDKNAPPPDLVDALAELRSSTAKTAADKVLCHLAGATWPEPEKKPAPGAAPAPATT